MSWVLYLEGILYGFEYLLICRDLLTKMIAVTPVQNRNGKAIIEKINDFVVNRYGVSDFHGALQTEDDHVIGVP